MFTGYLSDPHSVIVITEWSDILFHDIYETVIFISSINVRNGAFSTGLSYDGWDAYSPYTSPHALAAFNWTSVLVNEAQYNISVQNQVSWSAIYDKISGDYNDINGTINGIVGLVISYLSIIVGVAAADGWSPASGWADIASDILSVTGLTSAVIVLMLNGVVTAKSSVVVFGGITRTQVKPVTGKKEIRFI